MYIEGSQFILSKYNYCTFSLTVDLVLANSANSDGYVSAVCQNIRLGDSGPQSVKVLTTLGIVSMTNSFYFNIFHKKFDFPLWSFIVLWKKINYLQSNPVNLKSSGLKVSFRIISSSDY